MFARTMPASLLERLAASVVLGERATASMPHVDNKANSTVLTEYGIKCMTYGVTIFVARPGTMHASRTVALGMEGPTRSRAAVRMIT